MEADLDKRCPICLKKWRVTYILPCLHQFCFLCVQRRTRNRPQCPLCKQSVISIIHTVKVDNTYRVLVLRPAPVAQNPLGLQAAQLWPAVPQSSVGGLSPATEVPHANVTSALYLLGKKILLTRILQGHKWKSAQQFITFTMQRCSREAHNSLGLNVPPAAGAEEPSSAAKPRAAPHDETPVPSPVPYSSPASSNMDETPGRAGEELNGHPSHPRSNPVTATVEQAAPAHEEPEVPGAGPSATSVPQGTWRTPKRKATASQGSPSSKKRPPSQQE